MRIKSLLRAVIASSTFTIACPLISGQSARGDVVIDLFNSVDASNPWPVVATTETSASIVETGLSNVLGGVRSTTLETTLIGGPGLDFVQATIDPDAFTFGVLDLASTTQASADLTLLYDGGSGNLNADLSGEAGIALLFFAYDNGILGPNFIRVRLSDGTQSASLIQLSTTILGPMFFDFSMFSGIGSLDLASINSIQIEFAHGATGVDFRLDEIRAIAIPGPATSATLVALLIGIRSRRRRDGCDRARRQS